jgi:hypothetical protein
VRRFFLLLLVVLVGCDEPVAFSPPRPLVEPVVTGSRYDPQRDGQLVGVVRWRGSAPHETVLESVDQPLDFASLPKRPRKNPNRLEIDPRSGGLAGAFVWLEGVDLAKARPWEEGVPLTLTAENRELTPARGLVRVGEGVKLVSRDRFYHSLQGRGAAYFGVSLPGAEVVRERRLSQPGIVEVRSGAGFFWMRSYVLVQPHPYMAITKTNGEFAFSQVPAGKYRLLVWHPNPQVRREERSPDTLRVIQLTFAEAFHSELGVEMRPGQTVEVDVELGEKQ